MQAAHMRHSETRDGFSVSFLKSTRKGFIIRTVMRFSFSSIVKRNITLILVLLLAVAYCGSIDVSRDDFSTGGGLKAGGTIAVSHSLIASVPAAVTDNSGRSSGPDQSLEKTSPSSDILSRIARKILQTAGFGTLSVSLITFRTYIFSIGISICICLFFLTLVRSVHLKDGSK